MTRLLDVMNDWIGLDVLKAVHMAQGRRGLEKEKNDYQNFPPLAFTMCRTMGFNYHDDNCYLILRTDYK
jgi:hypothetical protein